MVGSPECEYQTFEKILDASCVCYEVVVTCVLAEAVTVAWFDVLSECDLFASGLCKKKKAGCVGGTKQT